MAHESVEQTLFSYLSGNVGFLPEIQNSDTLKTISLLPAFSAEPLLGDRL